MNARRIIAFKHESPLGNAPAHALFERVAVRRRFGEDLYEPGSARTDNLPPARRYADYDIAIDRDGLPGGVEIVEVL